MAKEFQFWSGCWIAILFYNIGDPIDESKQTKCSPPFKKTICLPILCFPLFTERVDTLGPIQVSHNVFTSWNSQNSDQATFQVPVQFRPCTSIQGHKFRCIPVVSVTPPIRYSMSLSQLMNKMTSRVFMLTCWIVIPGHNHNVPLYAKRWRYPEPITTFIQVL